MNERKIMNSDNKSTEFNKELTPQQELRYHIIKNFATIDYIANTMDSYPFDKIKFEKVKDKLEELADDEKNNEYVLEQLTSILEGLEVAGSKTATEISKM